VLGAIEVDPPRVWIAGSRAEVMGLSEIATEPLDVSGLQEAVERKVRLAPTSEHMWPEQDGPVTVRIAIEPAPPPADEPPAAGNSAAPARRGT
jgi:YbbR domain-containing protein